MAAAGRRLVATASENRRDASGWLCSRPAAAMVGLVLLALGLSELAWAWQFDPTTAQNVQLRAHIGGACRAIAVADNMVLIAQGPRLTSLDVTDPAKPVVRAGLLLPALIDDIAISGGVACVLAGGIWTIGLDDPTTLTELGHVAVTGRTLIVHGEALFVVGDFPDIEIVTIRDPSIPLHVASFILPKAPNEVIDATEMTLNGSFAFVSYVRRPLDISQPIAGGVMALDVSSPKTPRVILDHRLDIPIYHAGLDGDALYLLASNRLLLFDAGDPRRLRELASIVGPASPSVLAIADGLAYIATGQQEIWVYQRDGSGMPQMIFRGAIQGQAREIVPIADLLYVAEGSSGLRIYRWSPGAPQMIEIGELSILADATDLAAVGNFAYLADGRSGLRVFDLTNPDQPLEVGWSQTSGPAVAVCHQAGLIFVAEDRAGFEVFDISQPTSPSRVSASPTCGQALDVCAFGDYLLVADGPCGLSVFGIADPAHPYLLGQFRSAAYAQSVIADADRAFLCDVAVRGLWLVDISDPTAPLSAGRMVTGGPPLDVAIDGPRLALAEANHGLSILDVSGGQQPQTTGKTPGTGWFQGVALAGNLAYVADAEFGLRVVNALDPYYPAVAGFLATAQRPCRVAFSHGRAYMVAGEAGLYVMRYTGAPDLAITAFDYSPREVFPGEELFLTGEIVNNSTTPTAAGVWVDVVISLTRDFAPPRATICPRLRIEPGFSHLHPIDLSQQRFFVLDIGYEGPATLGLMVDADNQVAELREDNNLFTLSQKEIWIGQKMLRAKSWRLYR